MSPCFAVFSNHSFFCSFLRSFVRDLNMSPCFAIISDHSFFSWFLRSFVRDRLFVRSVDLSFFRQFVTSFVTLFRCMQSSFSSGIDLRYDSRFHACLARLAGKGASGVSLNLCCNARSAGSHLPEVVESFRASRNFCSHIGSNTEDSKLLFRNICQERKYFVRCCCHLWDILDMKI